MSFLNNVIAGISLGSVYAIIALGYSMVYGIARMLNFAHGDIIMVGAYVCFFAVSQYNLPPVAGVLQAMVICTVLGMVIERLAYKPLRQAPSLAVLITAIGVSYFLQNSALMLWKSDPKSFPLFISRDVFWLNVSPVTVVTVLVCVAVMLGLTWFTGRTKTGKAMRACSEDRGAAQLMGINVNATISITFAIGSALAAVAGILYCLAYQQNLTPTLGSLPGIKAFTAAVFGGIGSIPGALIGGLLLGIIETFAKVFNTAISDAVTFAVLIIVLLVKPAGLLGKTVHEKV